ALASARSGRARLSGLSVVLTFDDGNRSDHELALPALVRRGLRAAFFLSPALVGREGYLTWEEARALAQAGMAVGARGLDHTLLSQVPEGSLVRPLSEARQRLEAGLGRAVTSLSLPGGAGGEAALSAAAEAGFELVLG